MNFIANAAFIAAARDAVPALVAEVRRLRRAEHDLRADCQQKLSAAYLEAARLQAVVEAARAYLAERVAASATIGTVNAARSRLRDAVEGNRN